MLTQSQIFKVRESWIAVNANSELFGLAFYNTLFEMAPELKQMFKSDTAHQATKFTSMLSYLVLKLNRVNEMRAEMTRLAAIHNSHGVQPRHYLVVGEALLATLKKRLGAHFDAETGDAWQQAFAVISKLMIEAQQEA